MEKKNLNCSNEEHIEIKAKSYCIKGEIYMCSKCELFHSKLCKNHLYFNIENNLKEIFTGFCKEEKHNAALEFFCKNHNELCCAVCIAKIKKKGIGKHKDCDVCLIEDIKDQKKNKLKENIKCLEELANKIQDSINNLKIFFEKINESKEELKQKIQKVFTRMRNELNNREDFLLLEVDNICNKIYFKEEIIKESEKLFINF